MDAPVGPRDPRSGYARRHAAPTQRLLQRVQIAIHPGKDIAVQDCRRRALVFAQPLFVKLARLIEVRGIHVARALQLLVALGVARVRIAREEQLEEIGEV